MEGKDRDDALIAWGITLILMRLGADLDDPNVRIMAAEVHCKAMEDLESAGGIEQIGKERSRIIKEEGH